MHMPSNAAQAFTGVCAHLCVCVFVSLCAHSLPFIKHFPLCACTHTNKHTTHTGARLSGAVNGDGSISLRPLAVAAGDSSVQRGSGGSAPGYQQYLPQQGNAGGQQQQDYQQQQQQEGFSRQQQEAMGGGDGAQHMDANDNDDEEVLPGTPEEEQPANGSGPYPSIIGRGGG